MKILIIGCGSIGQAVIDPLLNEFSLSPLDIFILSKNVDRRICEHFGISYKEAELTKENFESHLEGRLQSGDWLLNLSVEVSSIALIQWCSDRDVFYLDTCVEPWMGGYTSEDVSLTTNYALRHQALSLAKKGKRTAVIAHGANPGVVTHFVKDFIEKEASAQNINGSLAYKAFTLGIKEIHISEKDSQIGECPENHFVNTWSPDGFISELMQRAEVGNGVGIGKNDFSYREHAFGDRSAVFLSTEGRDTTVKTWVPSEGLIEGLLVPHHESSSIPAMLTLEENGKTFYRPTVHYSYLPCEAAMESINRWKRKRGEGLLDGGPDEDTHLLRDTIVSGTDELGALFVFEDPDKPSVWYGSVVDIEYARMIAPFNNATSLQVVGGIVGAMKWAMNHPWEGVVEAEDMNHEEVLQSSIKYLGFILKTHNNFKK